LTGVGTSAATPKSIFSVNAAAVDFKRATCDSSNLLRQHTASAVIVNV
jgi:hypothetical protein